MVARRCEGAIAASKELGHVWLRMAQDLLRFAEIFVCSVESHSDRQACKQARKIKGRVLPWSHPAFLCAYCRERGNGKRSDAHAHGGMAAVCRIAAGEGQKTG